MRHLWNELMDEQKEIDEKGNIIARKIPTERHHFHLYYSHSLKRLCFAIELQEPLAKTMSLPACKGFVLARGMLPHKRGKHALVLSCDTENRHHLDFFLLVSEDITKITQGYKDEEDMISKSLERISSWQDFFKKNAGEELPARSQKGLYGELRSLELLGQNFPISLVVNSWAGPNGAPQDFHFDAFHLETKFTTKKDPESVRIHGFSQLSPLAEKRLFLHILSFEALATYGETVNDIMERITDSLRTNPLALKRFEEKLFLYGFPPTGLTEPISFEIESENFYEVAGDFPRLLQQKGIQKVEYDLLLATASEYKVDFTEILNLLKLEQNEISEASQ